MRGYNWLSCDGGCQPRLRVCEVQAKGHKAISERHESMAKHKKKIER
jgi:hypothetical protein